MPVCSNTDLLQTIVNISSLSRRSFEKTLKELESGRTTIEELVDVTPNDQWITMEDAAAYLNISYGTFATWVSLGRNHIHGIELINHKSRSLKNKNSRRGCGVLYYKTDLRNIRKVREVMQCTVKDAVRIFVAARHPKLRHAVL